MSCNRLNVPDGPEPVEKLHQTHSAQGCLPEDCLPPRVQAPLQPGMNCFGGVV